MTQAIITAQDTKAAQDLARRRGELVPELVSALEDMIRYFEPMTIVDFNQWNSFTKSRNVLAKVEALK